MPNLRGASPVGRGVVEGRRTRLARVAEIVQVGDVSVLAGPREGRDAQARTSSSKHD